MKWIKNIYHSMNEILFHLKGRKPWTRGYAEYKLRVIKEHISDKNFSAEKLSDGYGCRVDERAIEYPWFLNRIPSGEGRLLDAGSVLNFDYLLDHSSLRGKKIFISTLAPEPICYWHKSVSYVYEDLRNSCFKNEYFDWIASLSTIEHIGLDNTMLYTSEISKKEDRGASCLEAVREYWRMLKPAGVLYLSFPYGEHRNHGWFQIFNSEMLDEVINTFGPSSYKEFHYMYKLDGWHVSSREASKDATYFDIHERKEYDEDYAAASRAIVCLELVK